MQIVLLGRPGLRSRSARVYAAAAIDFLCRAFGFQVRLKVEGEGGRIEHSELIFGEGLVSVKQSGSSHVTSRCRARARP
jgi:uncharacterized glyoxalase superfamily protein PhnB